MESQTQPTLTFHGVDIYDLEFQSMELMPLGKEIEYACAPKVFYPEGENNSFKIIFHASLSSKGNFNLSLSAIGHFTINSEVSSEIQNSFINVNAPAIMFPYVRSFITTLTSNLGASTQPIILPPQFFQGELEEIDKDGNVVTK